jgi:AhpD family alkylhydroperoxidase
VALATKDLRRALRVKGKEASADEDPGYLVNSLSVLERENCTMMMDWNEYQKQLMSTIGDISKLSPDTVKGYMTLSNANSHGGHLDAKTRQLISLAVAVTTRCDGCITVHTDAAQKAGATREEVAEALGVAVAMNAGAALVYSARALDAFGAKEAASASAGKK